MTDVVSNSDFLTKMAARALGIVAVLEPVLPAFFEPAGVEIVETAAQVEPGDSPGRERRAEGSDEGSRPWGAAHDSGERAAANSAPVDLDATAGRTEPPQPAAPRALEEGRKNPTGPIHFSAERMRISARRSPAERIGAMEAALPEIEGAASHPLLRLMDLAVDNSRSLTALDPAQPPAFHDAKGNQRYGADPTQREKRASGLGLAESASAAVRRSRDDGASEPAVHVHIGRIEVKAAMKPAARPEKRVSRVSSLEDYLRRRAEEHV